jgi:hypothetical protein
VVTSSGSGGGGTATTAPPTFLRANRLAHQRAEQFGAVDPALGRQPVDLGQQRIVKADVELRH